MNQKQLFSKDDRCMLCSYLFYTFAIAWATEFLLIAVYHLNIVSAGAAMFFHFSVIGFGAGMAPAYAAFIVRKKRDNISFKDFCRHIFYTEDKPKTIIFIGIFALIQLAACVLQEFYLGYPAYMFVLLMPLMVWGGGLEEIGWRGIFQPLLEKRFSFLTAALIEGVIWSVWHLPLWFVSNTSQGSMNFIAFTLYCITLGLTLAAVYRLTKCIWATVLIHAWGNTVLGGMYTLNSLNNFPDLKTVIIYAVQIALILSILAFQQKYYKATY